MRKLKEVFRLHHELGLGQRQIAHSCAIGQSTVQDYLKRAQTAGLTWPLPEGWDDRRLEEALFGPGVRRLYEIAKPAPDFARLHEELQRHPHLTLQLVWEEYRQSHPDGYAYSRFCELYQRWRQRLDVVLRQEHPAGEKLFVDFAGATIPIHDPSGGPVREASLFVAVLGASNYTYAEATWSQGLDDWIGAHIRTFEFLGGVPRLVVPDNTRSGVSRACRYEPDLNRTYKMGNSVLTSAICRLTAKRAAHLFVIPYPKGGFQNSLLGGCLETHSWNCSRPRVSYCNSAG